MHSLLFWVPSYQHSVHLSDRNDIINSPILSLSTDHNTDLPRVLGGPGWGLALTPVAYWGSIRLPIGRQEVLILT